MHKIGLFHSAAAALVMAAATSFAATATASASPFLPFGQPSQGAPTMQAPVDQGDESVELQARFKRQVVDYRTGEAPGTIVIDTPNTYLYLVLGNGRAMRYGIGVGREGFTWAGTQNVTKKAEWPDWTPPPEMIERQPYLPRFMAGGPGNPLGARAMYLGGSVYRIHGTNDPSTIGHRVSSGCIRLTNDDVSDLYSRVNVGTKVVVLPMIERRASVGTGGVY
jgi:lipoprotein-anchoring transpeptidase ErfK/SrfK